MGVTGRDTKGDEGLHCGVRILVSFAGSVVRVLLDLRVSHLGILVLVIKQVFNLAVFEVDAQAVWCLKIGLFASFATQANTVQNKASWYCNSDAFKYFLFK